LGRVKNGWLIAKNLLSSIDEFQGTTTLGYWLGKEYWRQGIMSEALEKMLEFAFKRLKIRRIDVDVYTENEASNKLLEKFGFRKEGVRIEAKRVKSNGKIYDTIVYGLLRKWYNKV